MDRDDLLLEGILYLQLGDPKRAGAALLRYVKQNRSSAEGWLWLGRCLKSGGSPAKASFCFQQALAIEPGSTAAREELNQLTGAGQPVPAAEDIAGPLLETAQLPDLPVSVAGAPEVKPPETLQPETDTSETDPPEARAHARSFKERLKRARPVLISLAVILIVVGVLALRQFIQQKAAQYVAQGEVRVKAENYAEAKPLLDRALLLDPWNDRGYFLRATAYYQLADRAKSESQQQDGLNRALKDINQAMHIGPPSGPEYYLRAWIYHYMAGWTDYRADAQYLLGIALDNLLAANELGSGEELSFRDVPMFYFEMGNCQDGFATLLPLIQAQPADSPSAGLNTLYAMGLATCGGNMDEALQRMETALRIQTLTSRFFDRALYLYYLNRKDEALELLNQMIDDQPCYGGNRYYLRALIYYERGDLEAADENLFLGNINSWDKGGIEYFVRARMALDNGNGEEGARLMQEAEAGMPLGDFTPFLRRSQAALKELGVQPLQPAVSAPYPSTPIPQIKP